MHILSEQEPDSLHADPHPVLPMFLEPEDEWQPMLSIPLEAVVDDESCRARTDREQ